MWERRFVLAPLQELAPDLVDDDMVAAAHGVVEVVDPLVVREDQ
jgi:7,8-dihydro-6-hydroxymethylpterin-pyrophosphokinase